MKLLLIYGEKNVGKTTVCRRLYSAFKGMGATVQHYERINDWNDFESVLTLAGSKIAIYSAGDEKINVVNARKLGENWGCDVLIASVSYGIHYNETLEDLENNKDFFWFTLERGDDDAEMDRNESRMVLDLLNKTSEVIKL